MPVLPRFSLYLAACAASLTAVGCNSILGINEPEEGPSVRYYPWDGFTGSDAPGDVEDASVDDAQRDALPPMSEASVETSLPIVDSAVERRPDTMTIGDARADALRCLFHVPDGGGPCGLGCSVLCPLKNACGRDADCASGLCYAGLCTMPFCLN